MIPTNQSEHSLDGAGPMRVEHSVPEGRGEPGERVADNEEGWSDVLPGQELLVLEVSGSGPDLGVYEGVVLPPRHRLVGQVGQHRPRHRARGNLRH